MAPSPFSNDPVLLWGARDELHCSLVRRDVGPPYEITVFSGTLIIKRRTFDWHADAAEFAIAEMLAAEHTSSSTSTTAQSSDPSDPADPSDSSAST
jgi:hypothetical protein